MQWGSGKNSGRNHARRRMNAVRVRATVMAAMLLAATWVTTCQAGFLSSASSTRYSPSPNDLLTSILTHSDAPDTPIEFEMGAGVWITPDSPNYETAPTGPASPFGIPVLAVTGAVGFAGGSNGRSLTGQSRVSSSSGGAPAALCTPACRLPVSLVRFRLQRKEFLFFPDAPPFEVFRPPPFVAV